MSQSNIPPVAFSPGIPESKGVEAEIFPPTEADANLLRLRGQLPPGLSQRISLSWSMNCDSTPSTQSVTTQAPFIHHYIGVCLTGRKEHQAKHEPRRKQEKDGRVITCITRLRLLHLRAVNLRRPVPALTAKAAYVVPSKLADHTALSTDSSVLRACCGPSTLSLY